MTNLLGHIEETWPGVPIWMRKLHRVGPVGGASCESLCEEGRGTTFLTLLDCPLSSNRMY